MRIYLFLVCLTAFGQVAQDANSGYKSTEGRSRVAATLTAEDRDERQKPKELTQALNLKPGMTVVDLGTGAGYMLPFLSAAVGPAGKVIAQDIFPDFLDKARAKAAKDGLKNVEFILGNERDPIIPTATADVILVLDVYHHFDFPSEMLGRIKRALKPAGRLVIVEYHKSAEAMPNGRALNHIRLSQDGFIEEIEKNEFTLVEKHEHIPRVQWMGTFTAR